MARCRATRDPLRKNASAYEGGLDASGSKSKRVTDNPIKGYEEMQTRIANRKKEREKNATGSNPVKGSKNKRVKKSQEAKRSGKEANETPARELTSLLARDLESIKRHEVGDMPKQSDCTALLPLVSKMAKLYEPCSKLIKQTELMEGLGDIYSDVYDIRPRRRGGLVGWLTKVLLRFEWCDMAFQDDDGVMAIVESCE